MTTNSLSEKIKSCARYIENEHQQLDELRTLVDQYGDISCQEIFKIFAGVECDIAQAAYHWQNLQEHIVILSEALQRQVNFLTAICDYLTNYNVNDKPYTAKLINVEQYDLLVANSTYDKLTGLLCRNSFQGTLNQQLALAKRLATQFSILFIDIDNFKHVNDTYGHQSGDLVLSEFANIVQQGIRISDTAFRYGGEEFVVLMPNTSCNDAQKLANRIRESIEKHQVNIDGGEIKLTISGGVSSYPTHADNADELIYFADSAVYRAKGAGKNNIALFKEENRRYLRIPITKVVKMKELGFNHAEASTGKSKDIGIGGILFETSRKYAIGSQLQISLEIDSSVPIFLLGLVVRIEVINDDSYEIGMSLSFEEMDKLAKSEISQLLAINNKS